MEQVALLDDAAHELGLEGDQYVTIALGDEEYGIEILKVQEIISYKGLTALPNVASWVRGVFNLRGTVVPVIDLRSKFALPAKDFTKFTVIVVVLVQGRTLGMIVDAVSDVVAFRPEDIQSTPALGSKVRSEFIRGMGRTARDNFVILLDVERLLSVEELDRVEAALS
jgi:purine-binding chemotaxis protein CheW